MLPSLKSGTSGLPGQSSVGLVVLMASVDVLGSWRSLVDGWGCRHVRWRRDPAAAASNEGPAGHQVGSESSIQSHQFATTATQQLSNSATEQLSN